MDLWSQKVKVISDDVLFLAKQLLQTRRTFFVARTDDATFEVKNLLDQDGSRMTQGVKIPVDESYCGILFRTKEDVLQINDTSQDARVSRRQITRDADIGSYLGVRIELLNGETYGTICALDPNPGRFTSADVEVLSTLARVLSHALNAEYLAYRDVLSGTFNRRYFNELKEEQKPGLAQIYLFDVDNFKLVNDELGHGQGDALIAHMGQALRAAFPNHEVIRLGGDEFCVVISGTLAAPDLYIRDVMQRLQVFKDHPVTVSCGVASGDYRDLSGLLRRADASLYEAKRNGKNRFVVAD